MGKNFVVRKIFDCLNMPSNVRDVLFQRFSKPFPYEYINFRVYGSTPEAGNSKSGEVVFVKHSGEVVRKGVDIVSDWLHENGAQISENVIIVYSL